MLDQTSPSRHERVLDEAARQLNSKGVLRTSLAEIAETLGITRSAVYYYVDGLGDLVFQCYQRSAQITARRLSDAVSRGGTAADVLRSFVTLMLDPGGPELAARAEIGIMKTQQHDTLQSLHDRLVAQLAVLLETGRSEGVFRPCDTEIYARIVLSLITWAPLATPWARALGPLGHSRLLSAAIATLFEGFSTARHLPEFIPIDLSTLLPPSVRPFDREAMLQANREALLRIASHSFNRKGIDSTSLEEIAARVGATKRTVHHHFGNKAQMVGACFERSYRIFSFIRDRTTAYQGTRLDALAAQIHAIAIAYPCEELTPLSPLVGFGAFQADTLEEINNYSKEYSATVHTWIRHGIEDGSIRGVDIEARALMLPGLTSWLVKDDVPTDRDRREHIAREVANFLAVGLRPLHS